MAEDKTEAKTAKAGFDKRTLLLIAAACLGSIFIMTALITGILYASGAFESDDEIFHQTSKSERRVWFHTRITVSVDEMGSSWDDYRVLRVFRVVRWIFSNRPFVLATRASVGDDVAVSRGESVREENSEEGATVTRLMLMLVFWCARVRFVFHR